MILKYEESVFELMDQMVESASADQLFACGYLRGHVSLAGAGCEQENNLSIDYFKSQIALSLKENANELTPYDQALIAHLWEGLQQQVDAMLQIESQ